MPPPNLLFIFADQWRAQSVGYAGCRDIHTPRIDRLSTESLNFVNAVSGCPVCSPYRASLLTGQYPLTHGVFINDTSLDPDTPSIGKSLGGAGYDTAYIGKWHVDGHGRTSFIPPERRQGFGFWRVNECTHDYNHSIYYGDSEEPQYWEEYDTIAQTKAGIDYLQSTWDRSRPFSLFLSWGTPHCPYPTAPERFRRLYDPDALELPPNVPDEFADRARDTMAGYYAHISAMDECVGMLDDALNEMGLADNTLLVLTSDHGDMLGTRGTWDKQQPFEESIRVPFLMRWPSGLHTGGQVCTAPIDAPDIMPTLLGLCGVDIPATVEGDNLSDACRDPSCMSDRSALLNCPMPFGNWRRGVGGREYRGVRTARYTYARDLDGPWLLFDNETDPHQLHNLVDSPDHEALRRELDQTLSNLLARRGDDFAPGEAVCERYGYVTNERGIVVERVPASQCGI